jgi:hypothetical protein
MKITSSDHWHVQTHVTIRDGVRSEVTQWGDTRRVSIALEPGEVPDMAPAGIWRERATWFRPERADIEWKRNGHWSNFRREFVNHSDGWVLTNAGIRGTNVRADGSLGKVDTCALYANDDGWGVHGTPTPPELVRRPHGRARS